MDAADQVTKLETVRPRAEFLREIALAFATLELRGRESIALLDVNYEPASEDTSIDFSESGDNLSPDAAEALVGEHALPIKRLRLHKYFEYLERVWSTHQEHRHAS